MCEEPVAQELVVVPWGEHLSMPSVLALALLPSYGQRGESLNPLIPAADPGQHPGTLTSSAHVAFWGSSLTCLCCIPK